MESRTLASLDFAPTGKDIGKLMDFEFSPKVKDLQKRVTAFMEEHVYPNETKYKEHCEGTDRWLPVPVIEALKPKARAAGLWNLFLPGSEHGAGLTNLEYAPLCEIMGRSPLGPEVFNCSAPDTGNMEVLERYGSRELKEQWLKPLLAGEIRSCFAMTEPKVASSDATNIESSIVRDGGHYIINGHKWWSSGAGDPRCKVAIFMGKTDPRRAEAQAAIHDRGADGRAGRNQRNVCSPFSDTITLRTATARFCLRTCACRWAIFCWARGVGSKSRKDVWDPAGFTTACD